MVNYENLDNHQTGIDYFKYLKFGFGRATDIASLHSQGPNHARAGNKIVTESEGKFPWEYLGKSLQDSGPPSGYRGVEEICDRLQINHSLPSNPTGPEERPTQKSLKMTPSHDSIDRHH